MLPKKAKAVSVPTPEISVSQEGTKPRARAKTLTTKTKTTPAIAEKPVKKTIVRHASVSSRKAAKSVEPVLASAATLSPAFTDADVAARAYHIWLESGCPEGTEHQNWIRAEQELRAKAAVA